MAVDQKDMISLRCDIYWSRP